MLAWVAAAEALPLDTRAGTVLSQKVLMLLSLLTVCSQGLGSTLSRLLTLLPAAGHHHIPSAGD